jgi:hypothetical protein
MAETVDQSNLLNDQIFYYMNVSTRSIIQSFTPGTGVTNLSSITIKARKYGSPTGTITLSIYAANGSEKPTGSVLGSLSIDPSAWSTTETDYKYTFASQITVTAGVKYCMTLNAGAGTSGTNYWGLWTKGTNDYAGGNDGISTDSGATWTIFAGDFYFKTWYNPAATGVSIPVLMNIYKQSWGY